MIGMLALALAAVAPEPLVDATELVRDAVLDLRYATQDNFLKQPLYPPGARCLLRQSAARRLTAAAEELRRAGYRLRLFDCYRPLSVQWRLWRAFPKRGYVADPRYGSAHNRGAAVDLSLVTLEGGEVAMPTPFDAFTPAAHHGYPGGTPASRRHREQLLEAMERAGFRKNRMEWWHYELPDAKAYPVSDTPLTAPSVAAP